MTTKPRVQKPPAEIIGSFADVMSSEECKDGRSLFVFRCTSKTGQVSVAETFVLAGSELLVWKALHSHLGTIEKMNQGKMSERYREEYMKLMEEQNGETQDDAEA